MCLNSAFRACVFAAVVFTTGCERLETPPAEEIRSDEPSRDEILKAWAEGRPLRLRSWPDPAQLHDVDIDDPAHSLIGAYAASVKQRRSEKGVCEIVIGYTKEVKGPASQQLFPNHRFFVCKWMEKIDESQPSSVRSGAASVIDTLALDEGLKLTLIGSGLRYDKDFGEFLAESKVKITDEKSARLVWDAFCEVCRWLFPDGQVEKVSDQLWRLGVKDDRAKGRGKAYHEVRLNEDLTVKSMKHIIEDADGRRWD